MAVKDIKEPKGQRKTKPSGDGGGTVESPWELKDGKRKRSTRALPLEIRLREFFVGLSGVAALAGDTFTANAIEIKAEELAYGYAKLASVDSRVKRILTTLLEGSAWTEAMVPTLGLVIVVGWHWGAIPDQLGVPMTLANGMVPVTREQEQAIKAQAAKDQADAENRNGTQGGDDTKP